MIDNISRYASFAAVAKHGSISGAAKSLYISQPALSAEISKLENELGTKLFFRTGRGIKLTDAGEMLYGYISSAIRFIEAGEDKLRDLSGLKAGLLRIGASDMTLNFWLLDHISEFRRVYPDVKIRITNAPTPKTLSALRSGEIDFGVITGDPEDMDQLQGVKLRLVRKVRDIFVCSPDCPLASKRGVTVEELGEETLIMLEGETSARKYVYKMMPRLSFPDIELATSNLLVEFASRKIGIAAVVEDFAIPYIESGRLVKIDLETPLPERYMYIAYPSEPTLPAAAARFIEITENNAESAGISAETERNMKNE